MNVQERKGSRPLSKMALFTDSRDSSEMVVLDTCLVHRRSTKKSVKLNVSGANEKSTFSFSRQTVLLNRKRRRDGFDPTDPEPDAVKPVSEWGLSVSPMWGSSLPTFPRPLPPAPVLPSVRSYPPKTPLTHATGFSREKGHTDFHGRKRRKGLDVQQSRSREKEPSKFYQEEGIPDAAIILAEMPLLHNVMILQTLPTPKSLPLLHPSCCPSSPRLKFDVLQLHQQPRKDC